MFLFSPNLGNFPISGVSPGDPTKSGTGQHGLGGMQQLLPPQADFASLVAALAAGKTPGPASKFLPETAETVTTFAEEDSRAQISLTPFLITDAHTIHGWSFLKLAKEDGEELEDVSDGQPEDTQSLPKTDGDGEKNSTPTLDAGTWVLVIPPSQPLDFSENSGLDAGTATPGPHAPDAQSRPLRLRFDGVLSVSPAGSDNQQIQPFLGGEEQGSGNEGDAVRWFDSGNGTGFLFRIPATETTSFDTEQSAPLRIPVTFQVTRVGHGGKEVGLLLNLQPLPVEEVSTVGTATAFEQVDKLLNPLTTPFSRTIPEWTHGIFPGAVTTPVTDTPSPFPPLQTEAGPKPDLNSLPMAFSSAQGSELKPNAEPEAVPIEEDKPVTSLSKLSSILPKTDSVHLSFHRFSVVTAPPSPETIPASLEQTPFFSNPSGSIPETGVPTSGDFGAEGDSKGMGSHAKLLEQVEWIATSPGTKGTTNPPDTNSSGLRTSMPESENLEVLHPRGKEVRGFEGGIELQHGPRSGSESSQTRMVISQSPMVNDPEVLEQVSRAIRIPEDLKGSEIRVRLIPEHLGEVHIKISLKGDEILQAEFRAGSQTTRDILVRQVSSLENLLASGTHRRVIVKTGIIGHETLFTHSVPDRTVLSHANQDTPHHRNPHGEGNGQQNPSHQGRQDPRHPEKNPWEDFD